MFSVTASRLLPPTVSALGCAALLVGCAGPVGAPDPDRVSVVTTTPILADLARHVVGDRATVTSIVPANADPHSYEPSLRDVRDIVYADVAFSNYVLLEEHSIIKALDANIQPGVPNVSLAEAAVKYAAEIIPLVENVNLDTIWLGLSVQGAGADLGATRASDVQLSATGVAGPGQMSGYLTEAFGNPVVYFDSGDGFDAGDGYAQDTVSLPTEAHTHMSWTFDEPGVYRLDLRARLAVDEQSKPVQVAEGTVTFAVGVDPYSLPESERATVLDSGHADISVDLDQRALLVRADEGAEADGQTHSHASATDEATGRATYPSEDVIISVPNKALSEVPAGEGFGFLGRAGDTIYQLPQAVLCKHVHGEIDPHLWLNVRNAESYVEIIRDTLIDADPVGEAVYRTNAAAYLDELRATDAYVAQTIAQIPLSRRYLVTTHDAFAYLGQAYGLTIAGFVTPNPATEPSLAERRKLAGTIDNLQVPAVFLEPNLATRSSVLNQVADDAGIEVCTIYSDAFGPDVDTYVDLMRFDAESLLRCLG